MTKSGIFFIAIICLITSLTIKGQQLNGQSFTFSKGKTDWSDTIFRKLRTKEMIKAGEKAVLLAIRYRFVKEVDTGKWYEIEITNKSPETKVKFKVNSGRNQESYMVKLSPGETKSIQKLYWTEKRAGSTVTPEEGNEYLSYPLEDIIENRW